MNLDNTTNNSLNTETDKCNYTVINEGKASIIQSSFVFYNRVQEFNRDFSILAINTYLKNEMWKHSKKNVDYETITIVDALSATGLRSIRYALELDSLTLPLKIYANDISRSAIEVIEKNITGNNVCDKVLLSHDDAAIFMYNHRKPNEKFTIVDLDPYGSPAPFLDSAVQCVAEGGLLLVTCTDMAVLCGNHSETCHAKYGSISLKSKCCHEMALRIILRSIESHANRYGRYIVPLISLSVDFYVRIIVQIFTSPQEVRKSASKLAYVYQCVGCESFELQRLSIPKSNNGSEAKADFKPGSGPIVDKACNHCGGHYQVGGPIWADAIYSSDYVRKMLSQLTDDDNYHELKFATYKRMHGILQVISEELLNCPLYYCIDRLCRVVRCTTPTMKLFRSAILNGGYQVSYAHSSKSSVKTNAPNKFLWDIIREWQNKQSKKNALHVNTPGYNIINMKPNSEISFDSHPDAEPPSKLMQLLRYQVNPDSNWGPKSRPSKMDDKRAKNQGKRSRGNELMIDMKRNKQNFHSKDKSID